MYMGKKLWVDWITEAMKNLGGSARYEDLYDEIKSIRPGPFSKEWKATVRRTIETNSSDSDNFRGNNPDLFYSVEGLGNGVWGLRRN